MVILHIEKENYDRRLSPDNASGVRDNNTKKLIII